MDNSDENYNKENKKEYIIKEEYNIINNNDNNNNEIIIEENNKVKNDNIDNINNEYIEKCKALETENENISEQDLKQDRENLEKIPLVVIKKEE